MTVLKSGHGEETPNLILPFSQIEQAEVDDEGLGDIEDDMIGGAEDEAFFEEVAQVDAAEMSLDSSAHNILQVNEVNDRPHQDTTASQLRSEDNWPAKSC